MICVVIKGPSFALGYVQIEKAIESGADLVELYLSSFEDFSISAVQDLKNAFAIPMIFTLRHFESEEKRLQCLLQLAALKPAYLDIESHVPREFVLKVASEYPEVRLIYSFHDFEKTPKSLKEIYHEMLKTPAFFYKIAVFANSTIDMLRALSLAKGSSNVILSSMGLLGVPSRIVAPIIGSPITYACLAEDLRTAPGQLTIEELKCKYHYKELSSHSKIFALIGNPVDKSLSDITHNDLMQRASFDAVYVKMLVKSEELEEFFQLIRELPLGGLSVTMPLKEHVMQYLDKIDSEAMSIGAVNTLVFDQRSILGFNTDSLGALNAIELHRPVKGKEVVIIGAGGAAKAIAYEACKRGALVTILNRDAAKAIHLAKSLHCNGGGLEKMQECFLQGYDVLINSTPIEEPINLEYVAPGSIVMDIKTRLMNSSLLEEAKKRNCLIVYGFEMFLEQAVHQFKLWFKESALKQDIRSILREKLLELLK
ncbi:MAG: shikimate dehydrogenase [Chlamydiales bacterium]|nr:shikimate dehydrogenase [Chlamydiales bacterium]